jgi:5-oxoprolinase (ATP-hydrolysing)
MECSIISNNRITSPFGLHGGKNGTIGQNYLIRGNKKYKLRSCEQLKIQKGDKIEITTPSGGGYGLIKNNKL